METWRFRIVLVMALVILIFGDFLGYGNAKADKHISRRTSPTLREDQPNIFLDDEDNSTNEEMEPLVLNRRGKKVNNVIVKDNKIMKMPTDIRETCLPKMLCEMSAKSTHELNDKEKKLLELIRSTTLSLTGQPSKWHFAAHMGQLMRYSSDAMSGASGCAQLWPQCPYSTKRLLQLSSKVVLM